MCTVSFFPKENGNFIFTSNRDESPKRSTIPPEIYEVNHTKLLFPKDEKAGGTWIGISDKKRLICLLNGGFYAHIPKQNYRLSRGIVVTKLLTAEDVVSELKSFNFKDIEPFTIIVVDYKKSLHLYELVWDGTEDHFSEKPLQPIIWSSSLLYSSEIKKKREHWFSEFNTKMKNPSEAAILKFHKNAGEWNILTNLVMDRNFVRTKSITRVKKEGSKIEMKYEDLQTQQIKIVKL